MTVATFGAKNKKSKRERGREKPRIHPSLLRLLFLWSGRKVLSS
jgi:hypothetical protein